MHFASIKYDGRKCHRGRIGTGLICCCCCRQIPIGIRLFSPRCFITVSYLASLMECAVSKVQDSAGVDMKCNDHGS